MNPGSLQARLHCLQQIGALLAAEPAPFIVIEIVDRLSRIPEGGRFFIGDGADGDDYYLKNGEEYVLISSGFPPLAPFREKDFIDIDHFYIIEESVDGNQP